MSIDLNIENKLCLLVALYRSPSQSHNKFSSFITNLEPLLKATILRNPFLTMALGDSNAKNKFWLDQDGLTQIIHKRTHILFLQFLVLI